MLDINLFREGEWALSKHAGAGSALARTSCFGSGACGPDAALHTPADKGGNPDLVKESQKRRYADPAAVDKIIALDKEWRDGACATAAHFAHESACCHQHREVVTATVAEVA